MFAPHRSPASSYRRLDLETSVAQADPHKLVAMLFDGACLAIAQARRALREGRIPAKGEATGRAVRILEEGLKASLDSRGGEIASNLQALYDYMARRLLSANLNGDDSQYAEVAEMLDRLRDAWNEIGPQVGTMPASPTTAPGHASPAPAAATVAASAPTAASVRAAA